MLSRFLPGFLLSLAIIDITFASATLCGNAVLLIIIYRDPRHSLRTPSVYLVASLACSDFIAGLFVGYGQAVIELRMYFRSSLPPVLLIILDLAGSVALTTGIWTVLAMAIDRYIAISDPLHYPVRVTTHRTGVSIILIWIGSFVPSILYAFSGDSNVTVLLVGSHAFFTLPVLLMIVLQYKVFNSYSRVRREIARLSWATSPTTWRQFERERKIAITASMIILLFCISFLPFYIKIQLMNFCNCTESIHYKRFDFITHNFLYFSSLLDPVMYAWRIPKFRIAFKDCLRLRRGNAVASYAGNS